MLLMALLAAPQGKAGFLILKQCLSSRLAFDGPGDPDDRRRHPVRHGRVHTL